MNRSLLLPIVLMFMVILLTVILVNLNIPKNSSGTLALNNNVAPVPSFHNNVNVLNERDVYRLHKAALKNIADSKISDAIDKLRTALVLEPGNPSTMILLAQLLCERGRYKEAERIYRSQLSLGFDKAQVYNNLGEVIARQKRLDEAIRYMEKALEQDPDLLDSQLNLAGYYAVKNQHKKAISSFKKASEKLKDSDIIALSADPMLDNIRNDPEFIAIIKSAKEKLAKKNKENEQDKNTLRKHQQ